MPFNHFVDLVVSTPSRFVNLCWTLFFSIWITSLMG